MRWNIRCLSIVITFVLWASAVAFTQVPKPGKNQVTVRGKQQDVYFLPAAGAGPHEKVLFAPGDGGWRGFAIDMAKSLSAAGYDVYGIDTRHYLESFTGPTVLKTSEISADFRQLALWALQNQPGLILVLGWSEGAGLSLAAAADNAQRDLFRGVVAVGVTEFNILAWRWKDIGAEITKSLPNEPIFKTADYIGKVSPLPLFMVASTADEYVKEDTTRALFASAHEPKRLAMIKAGDHRFSGSTDEFYRTLKEALSWVQQAPR